MDLCFSVMTEHGPNRVAREQGWAAGDKWEEERGALYLEQLRDAGKRAFSLAWWQLSASQIYGESSPFVTWAHTDIGNKGGKVDYWLLSVILVKANVSFAKKIMTLEVMKCEMVARNLES